MREAKGSRYIHITRTIVESRDRLTLSTNWACAVPAWRR